VILFAVPLLIFQDTRKISTLGLAYAIEWLPCVLAYPLAGLLADRYRGAGLFLRATGARSLVLAVVVAVCLAEPRATVPVLMVNSALLSMLSAPVRTAVGR
jgi:hypothetical protein